ncbi:hypothetical protein Nepgr_008665 [Nepenthes gracilis]|uniref:TLC domain-containing protein n=1 Tax=Nepenthes gracilis TaxID=150966 RepID=A0AAD3XJL6_NEPGR|nr:hypothetical protein Nepgr_008665 [Nepenthes gracilis]
MEFLSKSIPDVIVFFPIFLTLYLTAYSFVFKNWNPKLRPEASSCLISLTHSTPALFLAAFSLFSDDHRGFASPNTQFQNKVLDYSIAYFIMDLIHYLVFYPNDVLFIAHHLATLFVFVSCRYLVFHGAFSILVLLILAEVSSLFQNLWTLAGARRFDVEFAAKMRRTRDRYSYMSLLRCSGLPLGSPKLQSNLSAGIDGEKDIVGIVNEEELTVGVGSSGGSVEVMLAICGGALEEGGNHMFLPGGMSKADLFVLVSGTGGPGVRPQLTKLVSARCLMATVARPSDSTLNIKF